MKMLLCSIGSKQRSVTLRFGGAVATALRADVTLLGVVDKERQAAELGLLLDETARLLAEQSLPVRFQVQVGQAEEIVLAELDQTPYDLVVLGALGDKRSRKHFLSSVAMHIIEQARTSVLVVKGGCETLKRVLICASGSEVGHLPIWAGAALACGAGARATVLHVIDALPAMYTGLEEMEETLAEFLQADTEAAREIKWAAQVLQAVCEISEVKLRRGIVADEILGEGQAGDYDLIVIGSSRSAGGLVRALLGDLTREIVTRAKRPVLVVRPMDRGTE